MLTTQLLHPEILQALGSAGHGARILIADANYPFSTESPTGARKVFLNVRPGLVSAVDMLHVLLAAIPIEAATLMAPAEGHRAALHEIYRKTLPPEAGVTLRKRADFYADVKSPATALVIATGEQRRFANILLTIGVVAAPAAAEEA